MTDEVMTLEQLAARHGVQSSPSIDDARRACITLQLVYESFQFRFPLDRTRAISSLMSAVLRPAMRICPMYVFESDRPAAGKSLCANIMTMASTGQRAAVLPGFDSNDRTQMAVLSLLHAAEPFILFDNVSEDVQALRFLDPMITAEHVGHRLPYEKTAVRIRNASIFIATGNSNMKLRASFAARSVHINIIGPGRRVSPDLLELVRSSREALARAVLTISLAYCEAGSPVPAQNEETMSMFPQWDHFVRLPLVWLGLGDF